MVEKIRNLARLRGTTIHKIEKDRGFANATIAKWDTSNPSSGKLKAVADHLGVSVDYLLDDSEAIMGQEETKKATTKNGDGILSECLAILSQLTPYEIAILTSVGQALLDSRQSQDDL